MRIPRTCNNQNEGRRSGYSQEENPRTYSNQNEDRRSGYSQEENPRAFSSQNESRGQRIYSRMMQRFRQKQRSWTAARKPMEFSRSFRTDMGLSAVKTFFRERMIFMFLRPRSADLI